MVIRKSAGFALAALLLLGTACAAAAPATNISASAAPDGVVQTELTSENAALYLPNSYEEYLSLNAPKDAAFSEDYIAIADGASVYLYDRAQGVYRRYDHVAEVNISKLQFSQTGDLYFSDAALGFFRLDPATLECTSMGISLSTFYLAGDTVYVASVSTQTTLLYALALSDSLSLDGQRSFDTLETDKTPYMTYADDTLYCSTADATVRTYTSIGSSAQQSHVCLLSSVPFTGLTAICAFDGGFYYAIGGDEGGLYRSDLAGNASELIAAPGFTALAAYGGAMYAVCGRAVRQVTLDGEQAAFTDYEISAASSSENRLAGACDIVRAGDLLVAADADNRRVVVHDLKTGAVSAIPCEQTPELVATDGSAVVYASGREIYRCTYGDTTFVPFATTQSANVRGLVCLYGAVYYVTENGMYGNGEIEAYHPGTPAGLACDIYGNLYVAYSSDNRVRSFTEQDFLTAGAAGTEAAYRLPQGFTSLRADFRGNVYCMADGTLYKNGEPFASFPQPFVYGGGTAPASFALGYEDSEVYFNFGNYLVKSTTTPEGGAALAVPSLNAIATDGAGESVYATHEGDLFYDIAAGTVAIGVDLAQLNAESTAFAYRGYGRTPQDERGLLLAQTDEYALLLVTDARGQSTAALYETDALTAVSESEYRTVYETPATMYLSSAVGAYYAPCLEETLTAERLARGTAVTVYGEIAAPDRVYALIGYTAAERSEARGYVPLSYLSDLTTTPPAGEEYLLAYLKAVPEGITFTDANGNTLTVTERIQVRLYDRGDGTYEARPVDNAGYAALITRDMIDEGNAEVLRIALIVILTVLALVILGAYIFLLPWEKYRSQKERSKKSRQHK